MTTSCSYACPSTSIDPNPRSRTSITTPFRAEIQHFGKLRPLPVRRKPLRPMVPTMTMTSQAAPSSHDGTTTAEYGGLPVLPCAARRASSCRASYVIGLRSWGPWPISAVHNLPPHTVNDYGLGIATMSVRREATNVDLRGVPNQGATSEPRFSSRSVADRLLDLRPGQHEGRPLVGKQPSDHRLTVRSNARRPGAPTSAARRLASSWQARGDSAT
jgi:hypothetical protein